MGEGCLTYGSEIAASPPSPSSSSPVMYVIGLKVALVFITPEIYQRNGAAGSPLALKDDDRESVAADCVVLKAIILKSS